MAGTPDWSCLRNQIRRSLFLGCRRICSTLLAFKRRISSKQLRSRDKPTHQMQEFGSLDWLSLPEELWSLVLENLQLEDFIRCRSVCSLWFSIISDLKRCSSEPRLPWLMLPPKGLNHQSEPWRFLDIASGKMHRLHLPELKGGGILGSSDGWLIVMDSPTNDLRLFNPFSKAQILLPSISRRPWIYQVYLSSLSDCGHAVVAEHSRGMSFLRSGDKAWTDIHSPDRRRRNWKGTFCKGLFYMLDNHRRVVYFDLNRPGGGSNPCPLQVMVPPLPETASKALVENLVVVPGNDQLLLLQLSSSFGYGKMVDAFRLDEKKAVKLRNLGGYSLFVTDGTCGPSYNTLGLTGTKGPIKENCVYIADQMDLSLDMFDMKTHCTTRMGRWDKYSWGRPVWVLPVLANCASDFAAEHTSI